MNLPEQFLDSLEGCVGFSRSDFIQAHEQLASVSIRVNPIKMVDGLRVQSENFQTKIPWCDQGYYLSNRPKFTLDPLLHAGVYYVQEASSMFIHFILNQIIPNERNLKVLDLCAAPGGKTTLLSSMPQIDFVLANEIISSRVSVLYENVVKWGSSKIFISNNDPDDFINVGEFFDIVLVDAPCSGSGLFRKDESAIDEWSTEAVNFCSLRQRRILQSAMQVLKPGGFLIYTTCSFSAVENEDNLDCLIDSNHFCKVEIEVPEDWGIVKSHSRRFGASGFRFYPDKLDGEGFFCGVLQKKDSSNTLFNKQMDEFHLSQKKYTYLKEWVNDEGVLFFTDKDADYAIRDGHIEIRNYLKKYLRLRKSGIKIGSMMSKGFVPDHELALSEHMSSAVKKIELNLSEALKYLRKESLDKENLLDGLYLITYLDCGLGWGKVIGARIKNYYPMAWRILMKNDPQ